MRMPVTALPNTSVPTRVFFSWICTRTRQQSIRAPVLPRRLVSGAGIGKTVNIPLPVNAGNDSYKYGLRTNC